MVLLCALFAGFAFTVAGLSFFRPHLLFRLRHPLSVTPESGLSDIGVGLYRVGAIVPALVGLWILTSWCPSLG
ncbi:hypothetical protein [Salinirubrum litoreum]|uniref:Uncharacterized protein n=1 Tax=Salinirubrum litoreum TaxID=1126234 RepID=A0ABD5R909_9EURY|nr:hypothetical protein [Salinirubrum litoreum]